MKSLDSRLQKLEQYASEEDKQSSLVRLTGLWLSQSQAGEKYLAGSLSPSSRLLILPNKHKTGKTDPDYIAYMAPAEKREKQQAKEETLL